MKHFGFRFRCVNEQVLLDISESRWYWDALVRVADGICALSRHRLCNSLVVRVYDLTERHVKARLAIPVDREHWVAWAKMTGAEDPSWWWDEVPEISTEELAEMLGHELPAVYEPDETPNLDRAFSKPRRFRQV